MAFDNGNGNGGGNGSVWWSVTHGDEKAKKYRPMTLANRMKTSPGGAPGDVLEAPAGPPAAGCVKVGHCVEGHDGVKIEEIGGPEMPGFFRVRLRFRDSDMENLKRTAPDTYALVEAQGKRIDSAVATGAEASRFLEIYVPAIRRALPTKAPYEWENQPWEINWAW